MHSIKARIYDRGVKRENQVDRYVIYFPFPKSLIKQLGFEGFYYGFNYTEGEIISLPFLLSKNGSKSEGFKNKADLSIFPSYIQLAIEQFENSLTEFICKDDILDNIPKYFDYDLNLI